MKKLALVLLLLIPIQVKAGQPIVARGSYCHDQACWDLEQNVWSQAVARAEGRMAHRIANMLARWAELGFPVDPNPKKDYIQKTYAHIHGMYVNEIRQAGLVWFFEVQGYDLAHSHAIEDNLISITEENVIGAVVSTWLYSSNL